jgi:hypothetical protein
MRAVVVLLAALSVGCASEGGAPLDGELRSIEGPYDGVLTIEPDPPMVGQHRVVITLDARDAPSGALEDAQVIVAPWMPAHGHGTSEVEGTEEAPGVYVAESVLFNMPGVWELRVHVADGSDARGELLATFDVP